MGTAVCYPVWPDPAACYPDWPDPSVCYLDWPDPAVCCPDWPDPDVYWCRRYPKAEVRVTKKDINRFYIYIYTDL